MAKNDHPQALCFLDSMTRHGQREAAEAFAGAHSLAQSADGNEVFAWAKSVCAFLDENYADETVRAIRMDCACGPEAGQNAEIRSLYESETDPRSFVEKTNALDLGFSLEYDGEAYYLIYPRCYCPCVNGDPGPLSKAWCYCTLGYSKRMFEEILGTEVRAELLSSVKTGGETCRIRILPENRA